MALSNSVEMIWLVMLNSVINFASPKFDTCAVMSVSSKILLGLRLQCIKGLSNWV